MPTNWNTRAICRDDTNPDRWVDLPQIRVRGKNNPAYDEHKANLAATCNQCPVFEQCLSASLRMNVKGVMAGMDEYDRADIRELHGLPTPAAFPPPENEEDARLIQQQFDAERYARKGCSNKEIAGLLDVSAMTISRLLAGAESEAPRRTSSTATAMAS